MFLGKIPELQFRDLQFLSGKFDNSDILHNITIQSNSQCRIVRSALRVSLTAENMIVNLLRQARQLITEKGDV